jgi:hypothetical protein
MTTSAYHLDPTPAGHRLGSGDRFLAGLVATALALAAVALWQSRPRLRKKP